MIKLWSWQREGEARPRFHHLVDTDYRRKRELSVLFPFCLVASVYCIARNLSWQLERKLYNAGEKFGCQAWRAGFRDGIATQDAEVERVAAENRQLKDRQAFLELELETQEKISYEFCAKWISAIQPSAGVDFNMLCESKGLKVSDNMKALLDKNIAYATGDFERHWPYDHSKELDAGNAPVGL